MYLLNALLKFDQVWCQHCLLAANTILPLEDSPLNLKKLVFLRFFSALSCLLEVFGLFFLVYGALGTNKLLFATGVSIKIASHVYAGVLHNQSAVFLSLFFSRHLNLVHSYQREFGGLLNKKGLTDYEIKGIGLLSNDLYNAELNSYPYSFYSHIFTPVICALALILYDDLPTALIVICLGLVSLPLGRLFYEKFSFRQQRELRLAETAHLYPYIENSYKKHISLTLLVNITTQIPLAIFTTTMLLGVNSSEFAHYLSITMGLSGLIGILGFQKMRVHSQHSVEKATHLLNVLSSKEFLIAHHRWKEHVKNSVPFKGALDLDNGVVLRAFTPSAFVINCAEFNLAIRSGDVCLLQAPSGYGKSTLILALLHLVEHSGEFYLVREGQAINIHTFSQKEIEKKIIFIRLEDLPPSSCLLDLFGEVLEMKLNNLYLEIKKRFCQDVADLAFRGSDNLIQREIAALEKGKKSPFPAAVLPLLLQMRKEKKQLVSTMISIGLGDHLHPERVLCTLSDGEQRRLVNLLTIETALARNDSSLIIFDEPLAHLDAINIQKQLNQLVRFQDSKKTPMLIISHHHIQEIRQTLNGSIEKDCKREENWYNVCKE